HMAGRGGHVAADFELCLVRLADAAPYQSVVIASDDDPYCRLERARQFAQDWGSRLVVLQGAGHINADSQLGAWPQGLKQLAALRRRACWRISPPAEKIPPVPAGIMAPPRYG
ncbi:alpha/beta hydrolase, partial [Bordetella bronchiseptica]